MNEPSWYVVADASRARIFKRAGVDAGLVELYDLTHPQTQLHNGDLKEGGKGHAIQSVGAGHHQSDPHHTPKEKHAESFAKELAGFLRNARADDAYSDLVLIADPSFLGRLRDNLDQATAHTVARRIDKNWAQHDRRKIESLLAR